jgi:hypothetical protein
MAAARLKISNKINMFKNQSRSNEKIFNMITRRKVHMLLRI